MVETIPEYIVEEDEGVVFYKGAHAYVPRLVQANVPWQGPAMPSLKYSTKRDTGGSLRTLGSETYAPSGIPIKPEDLLTGPKPTQTKGISVGSLAGAKKTWKEGDFHGVPDSKEPLKSLLHMLDGKEKKARLAAQRNAEVAAKLREATAALGAAKKKVLEDVLARKQVELDEVHHRLTFRTPVEFEPRHHGDPPVATFKDEAKAMAVLKDAAALLQVYDQARVVVEGHTHTPDKRMDAWAHELADNRAAKVKSALEGLGIASGRMEAVGKPGREGTGHTEVLLRITDL